MCQKLDLGHIGSTNISSQLVDRYVKYRVDVLEDVSVKAGDFYVPVTFAILEMEKDIRTPIILGMTFLGYYRVSY